MIVNALKIHSPKAYSTTPQISFKSTSQHPKLRIIGGGNTVSWMNSEKKIQTEPLAHAEIDSLLTDLIKIPLQLHQDTSTMTTYKPDPEKYRAKANSPTLKEANVHKKTGDVTLLVNDNGQDKKVVIKRPSTYRNVHSEYYHLMQKLDELKPIGFLGRLFPFLRR